MPRVPIAAVSIISIAASNQAVGSVLDTGAALVYSARVLNAYAAAAPAAHPDRAMP